mmetsp:Transcript_48668/g.139095  ORF Transcript_48668/g.139095 Transcript_48668/m.139095 type:complete len:206 (-) Transcript_48668:6-623(-)
MVPLMPSASAVLLTSAWPTVTAPLLIPAAHPMFALWATFEALVAPTPNAVPATPVPSMPELPGRWSRTALLEYSPMTCVRIPGSPSASPAPPVHAKPSSVSSRTSSAPGCCLPAPARKGLPGRPDALHVPASCSLAIPPLPCSHPARTLPSSPPGSHIQLLLASTGNIGARPAAPLPPAESQLLSELAPLAARNQGIPTSAAPYA